MKTRTTTTVTHLPSSRKGSSTADVSAKQGEPLSPLDEIVTPYIIHSFCTHVPPASGFSAAPVSKSIIVGTHPSDVGLKVDGAKVEGANVDGAKVVGEAVVMP